MGITTKAKMRVPIAKCGDTFIYGDQPQIVKTVRLDKEMVLGFIKKLEDVLAVDKFLSDNIMISKFHHEDLRTYIARQFDAIEKRLSALEQNQKKG